MEEFELFKIRPLSAESDKFIITLGNNRASGRIFENRIEAAKYIESKPWDLIMALAITIIKNYEKAEEELKKDQENPSNGIPSETK